MNLLSKEELAELLIYADSIDDIIRNRDFNMTMRNEFMLISAAVKSLTNSVFGFNDMEEFDLYKSKVRNLTKSLVKNKVE